MVNGLDIIGLAISDMINPCALAVMTMILTEMLIQDPQRRKKVLLGGLAFTSAVYILYYFYGAVMIVLFQTTLGFSGQFSSYMFKSFGALAIILGILNIKDFISYRPGGFATEMPLKMRPLTKLIIKKATSVKGAFIAGLIVTVFLLPCTMMPYAIATGILSTLPKLQIISWLLLYNLIFVLPMILITLTVYFGLTTVERISGWKEKNIKYLHLIIGLILLSLGILMVTGII